MLLCGWTGNDSLVFLIEAMADNFLGVLLFAFSCGHPPRPSIPQGNTKVSHKKIKSSLNQEPAEVHGSTKRKRGNF